MARPRRYETAAEKQRAYRERKLGDVPVADIDAALARRAGVAPPDEPPSEDDFVPVQLPARTPSLTEQEYVDREVAITRFQMELGNLKEALDTEGKGRLERCEAYARWRYRGFLSGEIASL